MNNFSEKQIEDYLFDDFKSGGKEYLSRGGEVFRSFHHPNFKKYWFRQFNLGDYGIADIVCFYRTGYGNINIEIYELKNAPIEPVHFEQVARYAAGVRHYMRGTFEDCYMDIRCAIVGPEFKSGHYIQNMLPIDVILFEFGFYGIKFSHHSGHNSWYKPGKCTFRNG